ncbi:HPF/RaiA family ribosome-associated protein [Roseicyclus sp.]|uniref:HPF/RaiA family ribosome-associated protein n=1 Tax=Roseicyclus sp. TaxID=1914329 RepID=UPI001BCCC7A5
MQIPLEIAFTHVAPSDEIKDLIADKIAHLEKIYDGIISAHVQIRAPHQRHQTGNLFSVTIELRVPGRALVVRRGQDKAARHEHLRVTLREAFAAMEVALRHWKDTAKGEVKSHGATLQGEIVQLDLAREFGQILATDNRLIYFHKNSLVDGAFGDLRLHDKVALVVGGDDSVIGPHASTVRPITALSYDPATKPRSR